MDVLSALVDRNEKSEKRYKVLDIKDNFLIFISKFLYSHLMDAIEQ